MRIARKRARRSEFLLVVAIFLAAIALYMYFHGRSHPEHVYAVVRLERVVDGDTFWAYGVYGFKMGQSFKVRLSDVDTPERGEPGFWAATHELNDLLRSAPCIILDVDFPPYDRYGRVVAVVYIPYARDSLLNVNACLLNRHLARAVDFPGRFHPEDFKTEVPLTPEILNLLRNYCK